MREKPNILFVCGRNKRRSKTAEQIFRNDPRFNSRSAGFSPKSPHQLNINDKQWADIIFVMEDAHQQRVKKEYRSLNLPPIEVLGIEDEYKFMDKALIELLESGVNAYLEIIE
ncbi:protein-tyrosine-phosphatase [Catalinimonas sp. 4WD22]|uniref:low molecular weight protein tyrosine phosphatase family protein n=1 Tax=Catalinimonas locisalis TaxID=3133978 RepID=UPI003100B184